jgi:hypothetical protein
MKIVEFLQPAAVVDDLTGTTAPAVLAELARPLAGKAGPTLGTIKSRMYADALAALNDTEHPSDCAR